MTSPVATGPAAAASSTKSKSGGSGSGFDDLWSMSLGLGGGSTVTGNKPTGAAKSIRDLEKEKAQVGIWGSQTRPLAAAAVPMGGGFGSFVKPAESSITSGGGGGGGPAGADDLLL